MPAAASSATTSSSSAAARSISSGTVTIGSMILTLPWTAARARARSWTRKTSGRASDRRMPRMPRNGLISPSMVRPGDRLVAAGVEGAEDHRPRRRPFEDAAVGAVLGLLVGQAAGRGTGTRCAPGRCRRRSPDRARSSSSGSATLIITATGTPSRGHAPAGARPRRLVRGASACAALGGLERATSRRSRG